MTSLRPRTATALLCAGAATLALAGSASAALAAPEPSATPSRSSGTASGPLSSRQCAPSAWAVGYSDALNKYTTADGIQLGGLSGLAWDARTRSWVSEVDNHGTDPSRIWSFRDLSDPKVTGDPLVLKKADGTPYDGTTADNEGIAVLSSGDYLISSETEPSIRIYGRDGVQKAALPVPARFAVTGTTPDGEATGNATLEGLTLTPDKKTIIAAMEASLSGDVSATGDATSHRFLVYHQDKRGTWTLTKQIAYRTETGNRVPEVAAYTNDSFLVEEAAFSTVTGNSVELYGVTGLSRAKDVSSIQNLSSAPVTDVVKKKLVANLVDCPSLGAPALEPQTNPLLDNFEGLAITTPVVHGVAGVSLIVDDNFSATETTRVLNLVAKLP
jgi:hypothetical protein